MARRRTLPATDDGAKLPEMVGAVIYVRVSTKEQTENLSLPTQLRACEEYCRRQFPLRGFVRCESCGRGLTGSWSKGRSEYYANYHCRPGCRAVNVTKAKLEGLFADELALQVSR